MKLTLIFIFCLVSYFPQGKAKLNEFNKTLSDLKKEIVKLQKELNQKKNLEKKSVKDLEKIDQQTMLINKLITKLKNEEQTVQTRIDELLPRIGNLQVEIGVLKSEYSKYIVWLYKYGRSKKNDLLFKARDAQQALKRYKYLATITDYNEKKLEDLLEKFFTFTELQHRLETDKNQKVLLARQKEEEQKNLSAQRNIKTRLVTELKKDKKNIEKEIQQKKLYELEIRNLITKIIDEEKKTINTLKTKQLKDKNVKIPERYNYAKLSDFGSQKGKLMWPVKNGKIHRKFGENKNEKLNTITNNYGLDISTAQNSAVSVVAEGFVSAISWIPGYGSVVIVNHKDDFRTVYGNIVDIQVEEGAKVVAGNVIGKVNTSLEGSILHFEIWNERNYQNPEYWLK